MKRIELINKITTYSARFVLEVEGFNTNNLYDVNIHAENFLIPVLNEVFNLRLENLNYAQKKNYPGIDLADFNNKVAFQITATSSYEKIKKTLETFFQNKLNEHFDSLYLYIITHKKEKYSENRIKTLIPNSFKFEPTDHIIDKDDFLMKINSITSTQSLEKLAKIFEHEFSEVQTEFRKQKYEYGFLKSDSENLFPNLLEISFPEIFYTADINIDEDSITEKINHYLKLKGKRPVKKIRREKLIKQQLRENNSLCNDWILHEGRLFTFKNLNSKSEPLRGIIDKGTIESIECADYYKRNDDTSNVFKQLLRFTFIELCKRREIEWFGSKKVFRFANNFKAPDEKRVRWRGKKESTKTVIFKMINKKDGHIICFRNLAFKVKFENLDDQWFLIINPTWSFTNPGGYRTSRFESSYMSGIKRLENNGSVYNYFRFFGYYLSFSDLFTADYPYLRINSHVTLSFVPRLVEDIWRPIKLEEKLVSTQIEDFVEDNELNLTLFD